MTPQRQADRYEAHGVEAEFEPGSRGRVLRNLAGVPSISLPSHDRDMVAN